MHSKMNLPMGKTESANAIEPDLNSAPMTKLVAMLCSEVQVGTPEHQDLHSTVTEIFSDHCVEEMISQSTPRGPSM